MNLRERLADWISGGALSYNINERETWLNNWRFQVEDNLYWMELASKRRDALNAIAAMETPGANATVKRMARAAREALE